MAPRRVVEAGLILAGLILGRVRLGAHGPALRLAGPVPRLNVARLGAALDVAGLVAALGVGGHGRGRRCGPATAPPAAPTTPAPRRFATGPAGFAARAPGRRGCCRLVAGSLGLGQPLGRPGRSGLGGPSGPLIRRALPPNGSAVGSLLARRGVVRRCIARPNIPGRRRALNRARALGGSARGAPLTAPSPAPTSTAAPATPAWRAGTGRSGCDGTVGRRRCGR